MSLDYIQESIAQVLNSIILEVETATGVPFTGGDFVTGVDWNLDNGAEKYSAFLEFLEDNDYDTGTLVPYGSPSDWHSLDILDRLKEAIIVPEEVVEDAEV